MKRTDQSIEFIQRMIRFADDCESGIQAMNAEYQETKRQISSRCSANLINVETWHKKALQNLNAKCTQVSVGVCSLIQELDKLETTIERVDKYYKRSKARANDCADFPSLHTSDDYVEALQSIVKRFRLLSAKYTEKTLPFLINDLNYLLSKKRKADYAELISLKNFSAKLEEEVRDSLTSIKSDEMKDIESRYVSERDYVQKQCSSEMAKLEASFGQKMETVSQAMTIRLEEVLPQQEISQLALFLNSSMNKTKLLNTQLAHFPRLIMPFSYIFPVDEYISMRAVQDLLIDKCRYLVRQENVIVLPALFDIGEPFNLLFQDSARDSVTLRSVQYLVLTFLSNIPVSQMKLAVIDPEYHGNSMAPYFELQRVEPEMFYDKIAINQDDIRQTLSSMSDYIDEVLRYQLTNEEDTVYSKPESANATLLLVFDFPSQFSDDALQAFRNILRNGYRCGIHTVIMKTRNETGSIQREREAIIREIENLCTIIQCNQGIMMTSALECLFPSMPDQKNLSDYLNRYLLTSTSLKNEGFIFNKTVKDLIIAEDEQQVLTAANSLSVLAENAQKQWCNNTGDNHGFPGQIVLGGAYYPFSVFVGRPAEPILRKGYNITLGQGAGIKQEYVFLPYSFDATEGYNLYIEYGEKENQTLLTAVHHFMWRMLSSFPVSKLHFSVISCENSLNSIAPFGELLKKVPDIFDDGICSNMDQVTDKLQRINQFIEDAMQNKLGHQFKNLIEYNTATPNRAEPLTMLVIFDYPKGFDSRRNEMLNNIMRNGRRCGIFTVICHNKDIQYSKYDTLDEFLAIVKKNAVQMLCKMGKVYLQPYGIEMDMGELPDSSTISAYTEAYETAYKLLQRKGLSFREIVDANVFERNSAKQLTIPIGLGDGDAVINILFGSGSSHHALIAGATGSGKSTLLHTLIMSSMVHYAPSQLHLYLLDFKSGTEFKAYEQKRLPHMKLLALDAMQEFGESILEDLVKEMTARGDSFKQAGCTKVEEYIRITGKPMPRILVIMDEFQILYNDSTNRRVANNCAELTKRIVTEGRAFGIHLIMATQSTKVIANLAMEAGTIEQMRIRIGMKCGESDARYLFSDRNDQKALRMMKGPIGTAVMNLEYTEEDNIGLRVAYCDAQTMSEYQDKIAEQFQSEEYTLQIFEGSRTEDLLDYLAVEGKEPYESTNTEINLGIMIKVAPPLALSIDRRKRHNMVICGANEDMTNNICLLYQLSVLRNRQAQIIDINGEWLVSDAYNSSLSAYLKSNGVRFNCCTQRKEIIQAIKKLHDEYQERKEGKTNVPLFVFFRNLQYLDIVQQMFKGEKVIDEEEKSSSSQNSGMFDFGQSLKPTNSITEKLLSVINDGASYGIFFIVTCSEYQVIRETMHYGENILPKFPERIIYALGDNDADHLIDGVTVSKIPANTVYFTDGVKKPFQFKPFIAPDTANAIKYLSDQHLIESEKKDES